MHRAAALRSHRIPLRQLRLEPLRRQRRAAQAHAGGVEDGVGERSRDRADRAFAGAGWRQFGAVNQHDVDRLGRLGDVEDRVGEPIDARHFGAVEADLL